MENRAVTHAIDFKQEAFNQFPEDLVMRIVSTIFQCDRDDSVLVEKLVRYVKFHQNCKVYDQLKEELKNAKIVTTEY